MPTCTTTPLDWRELAGSIFGAVVIFGGLYFSMFL
tara:strand:+ start:536 stop:640 length:105 start_codon:yes stop_codon:yes gene_type:complete